MPYNMEEVRSGLTCRAGGSTMWFLSRKLFKEAIGEEIPVGIIASEYREYDSKRWWKTSSGVSIVLNETIAYIYAKFLFNPERVRAKIATE